MQCGQPGRGDAEQLGPLVSGVGPVPAEAVLDEQIGHPLDAPAGVPRTSCDGRDGGGVVLDLGEDLPPRQALAGGPRDAIAAVLLAPTWPGALLAKEIAGIDGVSGGRLPLGVGVGSREDEFTVPGIGRRGRGAPGADLATYRDVWAGKPVGDGPNPAVRAGTRQVPVLFGGYSPGALGRMVRWGEGDIRGALPPARTAPGFEAARSAWREAGRPGAPRLVALAHVAVGDADAGRGRTWTTSTGSLPRTSPLPRCSTPPGRRSRTRSRGTPISA